MEKIERWAKLLRDIGLILGVPTLIVIASNLYSAQISALKEQNEILKLTQYDKALVLIDAQEKLIRHERRISADSLAIINQVMKDVEAFTYYQSLPDDFSPDLFERNIQEVTAKLKELESLLSSKGREK